MTHGVRLLIGSHSTLVRGGAEAFLRGVVPALEKRGWDVRFLLESRAPGDELGSEHTERTIATCPPRSDTSQALQTVRKWRPDVVLQNGLLDPRLEADLFGIAPVVLFAHGYYGTCISGSKRWAFPSLQVCHRKFGPACLALYFPRRCGGLSPQTAIRAYLVSRGRNAMLHRYARICVASKAMQTEYLRHGIPPQGLAVLPLFPDCASPDPIPPGPGSTEGPILMVSRLTSLKGGALLLSAVAQAQFARKRPMEVQFAGDGPQAEYLRKHARRLGVSATFFGWCDASKRQTLMRSASLLAVPSTWPEPFGIVGLEAGCVGLPAVGFANGGISEWLVDGYSGVAAEGELPTAENLGVAIVRALEDPLRYQRLRFGAWEVSHRFTLPAHADKFDEVLRGATGSSS